MPSKGESGASASRRELKLDWGIQHHGCLPGIKVLPGAPALALGFVLILHGLHGGRDVMAAVHDIVVRHELRGSCMRLVEVGSKEAGSGMSGMGAPLGKCMRARSWLRGDMLKMACVLSASSRVRF